MIPKFRAWDKTGKLYQDDEVSIVRGHFVKSSYTAAWWADDAELFNGQQSTGLKDKNGVEIYEGDIIKLQESHTSYYVVEWHKKGMWVFRYIENKDQYYPVDLVYSFSDHIRNEVIGNIYEDKELLEVEG